MSSPFDSIGSNHDIGLRENVLLVMEYNPKPLVIINDLY